MVSVRAIVFVSALLLAVTYPLEAQEHQPADHVPAHPLPASFLDHTLPQENLTSNIKDPQAQTQVSPTENQTHEVKTRAAEETPEATPQQINATTTPENAEGHDWIFSQKRALGSGQLQSATQMFTSERACGFAIPTERGLAFPWMASLQCNAAQCFGTLISNSLVLASASCVQACGTNPVTIRLGDPKLLGCSPPNAQYHAIAAVVNPKFTSTQNTQYDMALVQIQTSLDFNLNPFVYPICLLGVETDDPTIECDAVVGAGQQEILTSPVNCYQPGNQVCIQEGLDGVTGCLRQHQCNPTISNQRSVPVICRRVSNQINRGQTSQRYYLWGLTTPTLAAPTCTNGVSRVSDSFAFITQGMGL